MQCNSEKCRILLGCVVGPPHALELALFGNSRLHHWEASWISNMPLPCPEARAQTKHTYIILVYCTKNKSQSPKKKPLPCPSSSSLSFLIHYNFCVIKITMCLSTCRNKTRPCLLTKTILNALSRIIYCIKCVMEHCERADNPCLLFPKIKILSFNFQFLIITSKYNNY